MTDAVARRALALWGLQNADLALVAQRENVVFRVDGAGDRFALRLHRPGYQTPDMMRSELSWMQQLRANGLNVPAPLPSEDGTDLRAVEGYYADLLTWLPGRPIGATGKPLDLTDRTGTFHALGTLMSRVHRISDDWTPPTTFCRKHWDIDGLLGPEPLWGPFWDNPGLVQQDRARVVEARDRLRATLAGATLDFGLIHADMVRENVLIDGTTPGLIDFDDSGFGFRLFDVATTLFKNRGEADYPDLEAAFLRGYRTVRPLDTALLPQFMVIRALSYLGWIIPRMDEPGAKARQQRFLAAALPLVDAFLDA